MAGQIRVTPEELHQMATQYQTESGKVEDVVHKLDSMIQQLQGMWEGASSEAFASQYHELRPSFQKMSTLLQEIHQQLNQAANTMQETDQSIASQMKG